MSFPGSTKEMTKCRDNIEMLKIMDARQDLDLVCGVTGYLRTLFLPRRLQHRRAICIERLVSTDGGSSFAAITSSYGTSLNRSKPSRRGQ